MNLGENIYQYRKKCGMSQGDLADALDVSRQSVSKWETGSAVPELEKLVKMSNLFGISLDELVGNQAPQPEPEQKLDVNSPAPAEPAEKMNAQPTPIHISRQMLIGAFLLLCSLIGSQILAAKSRFDAVEILLLMAPVLLCGILCLTITHPDFYCGWISVIGY